MFVTSVQPFFTRALANALVSALSARPAAALLVTPFVKLFTAASANPSPDSVPADFTEATFAGYAGIALTLPLVGPVNLVPSVVGGHNEVDFIGGAVVSPGEVIIGYYVVDDNAAPTKVYLSELFASPIPIVNPGDTISLDTIFGVSENVQVQ